MGFNIGALIIRIGFGGIIVMIRNPQNGMGILRPLY